MRRERELDVVADQLGQLDRDVVGLPDRVAMRRLVAQIQAVRAPTRLAETRRGALGRRELARERRLQRAQRRRLKPALARLTPHRGDIAAQPQVRIAQLAAEHQPSRAGATTHERTAGRQPAPQRPLGHAQPGSRRAHIGGRQLASRAARDEVATTRRAAARRSSPPGSCPSDGFPLERGIAGPSPPPTLRRRSRALHRPAPRPRSLRKTVALELSGGVGRGHARRSAWRPRRRRAARTSAVSAGSCAGSWPSAAAARRSARPGE